MPSLRERKARPDESQAILGSQPIHFRLILSSISLFFFGNAESTVRDFLVRETEGRPRRGLGVPRQQIGVVAQRQPKISRVQPREAWRPTPRQGGKGTPTDLWCPG